MLCYFRKYLFILLISPVSSCLDNVETKCHDYNCAVIEGIINQGWIPTEMCFESMTNIYQKTDIDINTCIFAYTLSQSDFDSLMLKIKKTDSKKVNMPFFLPKWWKTEVLTLENYSFFDNRTSDTVFTAIDKNKNKIYGWREK